MDMNYCYPTTMYESIFAQMYVFLVEKYFFLQFLIHFVFVVSNLTGSVSHNFCMDSNTPFIHCSHISVVHVKANINFCLKYTQRVARTQIESLMTDKHAAKY